MFIHIYLLDSRLSIAGTKLKGLRCTLRDDLKKILNYFYLLNNSIMKSLKLENQNKKPQINDENVQ